MSVEKVIRPENLLLAYLNYLLLNGYTDGITEEEFFKFVDEINYEFLKDDTKCEVEKDSFLSIVDAANSLNNINSNRRIYTQVVDKKLTVLPTYDLKIDTEHDYLLSLGFSYNQIKVLYKVLSSKIANCWYEFTDFKDVSKAEYELARVVGAFLINNLIVRYIKFETINGRWPVQCSDIDTYIFKKNIASYINLPGTSTIFEMLYLQAIKVVYELLINNKNSEQIMLSTYPENCLAYANYKKILMPIEFIFLQELEEHTLKEKEFLNIRIENGVAMFNEEKYMYTYSGYRKVVTDEQLIYKHEIALMESRISKNI